MLLRNRLVLPCLLLAAVTVADEPADARIRHWIDQLGTGDVEARRVARLNLAALAPDCEDALIEAIARAANAPADIRWTACTPALARRWNAALALGEVGGARSVTALRERLADPTEHLAVAAFAAISLARLGDAAAVPDLVARLDQREDPAEAPARATLDPDFARQAAAFALGTFRTGEASAALVRVAGSREAPPRLRGLCILALGGRWTNPEVAGALLAGYRIELREVRVPSWIPYEALAIALACESLPPEIREGSPLLGVLLTPRSHATRTAAALSLSRMEGSSPALRGEMGESSDARVQATCHLSLAARGEGDPEAVRTLLRASSQDAEARRLCCAAMEPFPGARADLLAAAQRDIDQRVRAEALRSLHATGSIGEADRLRLFRSSAPYGMKIAILEGLLAPAVAPAPDLLTIALADTSDGIRWLAAAACGGTPGRDVEAHLRRALTDRNGDVREQACLALGRIGVTGDSRSALQRCANTDDWDRVRAAAHLALGGPVPIAPAGLEAGRRFPIAPLPAGALDREIARRRRTLLAELLQAVPGQDAGGTRVPSNSMQRPDGPDPSQKYDLGELAWMIGMEAVKPDPTDPANDLRYEIGPRGYEIGPRGPQGTPAPAAR